jgi:hypothetical protein
VLVSTPQYQLVLLITRLYYTVLVGTTQCWLALHSVSLCYSFPLCTSQFSFVLHRAGSPWPSLGAPGLPGAPSNYLNKRPALRAVGAAAAPRRRFPDSAWDPFSRAHLKANLITWPGAIKSFSGALKLFSGSLKLVPGAIKLGIILIRPLSSHP